jgi:hypothetical protein
MTTANTEEEVLCEDGATRPLSVCVQDHAGRWHDAEECVDVDGTMYNMSDALICYVETREEWYLRDDCIRVGSHWEHENDAFYCYMCSRGCSDADSCTDPNGASICERCYDYNVCSCNNCGEQQWCDESTLDEDGYCTECAEPASLISGYSDKTANRLKSETKDKLRFGVELEVEGYDTAEQAAEYIRQHLPATYCTLKRDGSLGESGVEIVTRPDSMAVHKRMFGALFKDSPGKALSSWTNGRCGMHVHVSKAALSQLQIGKMLCFLNEPAAVNFISKIAGRKPCNWCKVHKKKITDTRREHDRYTALNVTNNHTVEVRIFKGTLAEAGFMKNLEFVQALVEFTAPASRSISQATSHRAFCEWLPKKAYPHLHAFLVAKGFIRRRNAA